ADLAAGSVTNPALATGAVTASNIAPGQVVKTLNGLTDNVGLAAGANITLTPSGNVLTIAAPNSLTAVAHDSTSTGNGTSVSPLGVSNASQTAAFFSNQDTPGNVLLSDPGKDVVVKTVTPGSYAIFAHVNVFNADTDNQDVVCTLSTGAKSTIRIPPLGSASETILSLQDAATFNAESTIKMHCTGFKVQYELNTVALTAIKVTSIQ